MSSGPAQGDSRRTSVILGIGLILLGGLFLLDRALNIDLGRFGWPLFVIVPGLLLLVGGLSSSGREGSGLAVAGGITTTVGIILAIQNATGLWATWAYAWALVGPGAAGAGLALFGLVRNYPDLLREGLRTLGVGVALFAVFGLFFEGVIGLSGEPFLVGSDVLPVALIVIGIVVLGGGLLRGRRV
ncbi:MAG TPA: hypothetical protein VK871_04570 [Candidatus Limnocylindrales bacterium]|nr:hypothetical protein [Candidatus Limnocylindrales bacterium]